MIRRLALTLAACLPLAAVAQSAAPSAPPAAAAPVAAPAPAASGVTVDLGGWMVLNTYFNWGGTNSTDLPQRAAPLRSEVASGMQVRQSRIRANLGLPGGGLIGDAKIKGLVELDFMGGSVGGDQSLPLVRLRHAWVGATWKDLGNLTLTVGQTWGLFTGPYFASSLGHLAVPRFGGAGFLFRRAPQVRLSGDTSGDLGITWAVAALSPMDKATVPTTVVTSGASVGERSGMLDLEGRFAVAYKTAGKSRAEVGFSMHLGQDRYLLYPGTRNENATVPSNGLALDAKIDLGAFTLLGAAWEGTNLDIYATSAPGVKVTTVGGAATDVKGINNRGGWVQLQIQAGPSAQLLLGMASERPEATELPASTSAALVIRQNDQYSGGVVFNLAPKWKAAVELTHYNTTYNDAVMTKYAADQLEISTLYAF